MDFGIKQTRWIFYTLVFSLFLSTQSLAGGIFKWTDENGRTHFTDKPPINLQSKEIKVKTNPYKTAPASPLYSAPTKAVRKKKKKSIKRVTMYSAEWCGVCKTAKAYFKKKGIRYTEYDVEKSEKGKRDYKRLKGRGVPLIVSGKKKMTGFSPAGFEAKFN